MTGVNEGHRQRLRNRMLKEGLDNFQDHEILEFLLFQYIPRKDTNKIAHNLLKKFGSLGNVFNANPEQLMMVDGISQVTACNIAIIKEVWRRYKRDESFKISLSKLSSIIKYAQQLMDESGVERVVVVYVDGGTNFLFKDEFSSNNPQYVDVDIKEIIATSARLKAAGIVLFHCHPHGQCAPSQSDLAFTEKLYLALASIDNVLLDHIIFNSRSQFYSFHKERILEIIADKYKIQ